MSITYSYYFSAQGDVFNLLVLANPHLKTQRSYTTKKAANPDIWESENKQYFWHYSVKNDWYDESIIWIVAE